MTVVELLSEDCELLFVPLLLVGLYTWPTTGMARQGKMASAITLRGARISNFKFFIGSQYRCSLGSYLAFTSKAIGNPSRLISTLKV